MWGVVVFILGALTRNKKEKMKNRPAQVVAPINNETATSLQNSTISFQPTTERKLTEFEKWEQEYEKQNQPNNSS